MDLGFSNFAVTTTGNSGATPPSISAIDVDASGTPPTGDTFTNPVDDTLTAAWTTGTVTSSGSVTLAQQIGYLVTPNLGDPPTDGSWALDGLAALSISGQSITGSHIPTGTLAPEITLTETFCLGATSSSGCNASDEGTLTLTVTSTGGGSLGSPVVNSSCGTGFSCIASNGAVSFSNVDSIFTQTSIEIIAPPDTSGSHSYSFSFSDFGAGYDQDWVAPEPSSFVLLGTALVGLGLISLRRRHS